MTVSFEFHLITFLLTHYGPFSAHDGIKSLFYQIEDQLVRLRIAYKYLSISLLYNLCFGWLGSFAPSASSMACLDQPDARITRF